MDSDNRKCRLCKGMVEISGSIPSWWGICTEMWILGERVGQCSAAAWSSQLNKLPVITSLSLPVNLAIFSSP